MQEHRSNGRWRLGEFPLNFFYPRICAHTRPLADTRSHPANGGPSPLSFHPSSFFFFTSFFFFLPLHRHHICRHLPQRLSYRRTHFNLSHHLQTPAIEPPTNRPPRPLGLQHPPPPPSTWGNGYLAPLRLAVPKRSASPPSNPSPPWGRR